MSFVTSDRTKESSSTTGTGAITLSGAPSNYVTFNTAVGVNNFCWYAMNHLSANEWEVGYAQLTGATTLTRIQVLAGTNGTSFVNFSAGTKEVFVTLPSSFNAQTMGRTNIVINPHGSIQQETTAAVTTNNAYFADQWLAQFVAAGGAFQTGVTTGTVSSYDPSYMFTKTTTAKGALAAGDLNTILQPIEGSYTRRLLYGGSSAKGSWLRWRASSSQSGTASVAIRNGASDRSFVQAFAVTTTPTDYFLFVPGDTTGTWPTNNAVSASITFCHAAGTTFQTATLGAWQAGSFFAANTQSNMLDTVNRQLNITDVQWSQSSVLLPFEPIDYQQELARCQRYWEQSFVGSSPGIVPGSHQSGIQTAFILHAPAISYPVEKRTTPSITVYASNGGSSGNLSEYDAGSVFIANRAVTSVDITAKKFSIVGSSGNFTVGNNIRVQWIANARM